MAVEQHRLTDRVCSHEARIEGRLPPGFEVFGRLILAANRLDLRELRAGLQAAATTDARGQRIGIFLKLRRDPGARTVVV